MLGRIAPIVLLFGGLVTAGTDPPGAVFVDDRLIVKLHVEAGKRASSLPEHGMPDGLAEPV